MKKRTIKISSQCCLPKARLKATEMISEIGLLDDIEVLHCIPFEGEENIAKVEESIAKIMKRNHAKECPFCAEIIKELAKVCKHYLKELEAEPKE